MPRHERYLLQIWRSQARAGRQWAARLDCFPDGERHCFTDPEALLEHVRALVESPNQGLEEKGGP